MRRRPSISECAKLARTTSGRNQQLNASAFSVGQLVGAGTLDRTLAEQRLFDAATTNGYVGKDGAAATRSTIKSGLDRGERSPRNIQLRDKAPDLVQATRRRVNDVITSSCLDDAERVTRARYLWAQRQALDGALPVRLSRPERTFSGNAWLVAGSRRAWAGHDSGLRCHH